MAFVNQRIAVAEQYVEGCVHIPQAGRLDHATGIYDASCMVALSIDQSVLSGSLLLRLMVV
jgi:thiamine monophosphate synthase